MRLRFTIMAAAVLGGAMPAMAQELTPWGGWENSWHSRQNRTNRGYRQPPAWYQDYDDDFYYDDPRPRIRRGPALVQGGPRPEISPQQPETVAFPNSYDAGSIIIDTAGRQLFFTLSASQAYRYPISVGREGFTWSGTEKISRVAEWPDWHPPAEMRDRDPKLPEKMTGGLNNPLGAKALYLGNTLYRIHGTNDPKSIGRSASSGCFRMLNAHVVHLASFADIGTPVIVVKKLPAENIAAVSSPAGPPPVKVQDSRL